MPNGATQRRRQEPHEGVDDARGRAAVLVEEVAAREQDGFDGREYVEEDRGRPPQILIGVGLEVKSVQVALALEPGEGRRERHVDTQAQREDGVDNAPDVGCLIGHGLRRLLHVGVACTAHAAQERFHAGPSKRVGSTGAARRPTAGYHLLQHLHHRVVLHALHSRGHLRHARWCARRRGVYKRVVRRRGAYAGRRGPLEAQHHLAELRLGHGGRVA